jgi:hypothetical protein
VALTHSHTHTLTHSHTHTLSHRDKPARGPARGKPEAKGHSHTHTLTHAHTHALPHYHTHTLTHSQAGSGGDLFALRLAEPEEREALCILPPGSHLRQGFALRVWGLGFRVKGPGSGFEVQCWVEGLRFGVWDLGFGVWGLGYRVGVGFGVRLRV